MKKRENLDKSLKAIDNAGERLEEAIKLYALAIAADESYVSIQMIIRIDKLRADISSLYLDICDNSLEP